MELFEELTIKAKSCFRAIVFPEGEDANIIQAAIRLKKEKILAPILLGDPKVIEERALGEDLFGIVLIDPSSNERLEAFAAIMSVEREMPERVCQRMLRQPLYFGAMLVKTGGAHGMVAGISCPTSDVILAAQMIIGLKDGIALPSSFYLMDIPAFCGSCGSLLIFADPAVNPNPTAVELADIAISTADSAKELLGWTPRVALLSFSTIGSGDHPDVEKVAEATQLVHEKRPELFAEGEMQADAALIPEVARKKTGQKSMVAGQANILIFPDLDAANISSKLVQKLGRAVACSPVLQGFRQPVSDLSRSANVEDIIHTALFVAARE